MDNFNPFANAWGDDTATTSQDAPSASTSTFKFPEEDDSVDRLRSATAIRTDDPLGFKSSFGTPAVVVVGDDDDGDDAWGAQPVASTSSARLGADKWSTAPSTPKPPHASPEMHPVENSPETTWQPSAASPAVDASSPAWAIEGGLLPIS